MQRAHYTVLCDQIGLFLKWPNLKKICSSSSVGQSQTNFLCFCLLGIVRLGGFKLRISVISVTIWAKFIHFGNIFSVLGKYFRINLGFGKMLNLLWQIC